MSTTEPQTNAASNIALEGVVTTPIKTFDPGPPQTPPCVIDDKNRGRVMFFTGGDEPFRAHFEMKVGQIRGQAYHTEGNTFFDIVSGSYVSIISDPQGENLDICLIEAPATMKIPAMRSHTFIPLTDGVILEASDIGTKQFLGNTVRVNDKLAPVIAGIKAKIENGEYRLYRRLGLPTDIK
jgi:hypothetical protein